MPLACSEPAEAQLEAQRIAAMVELDEYRLAASEVGLGEEETAEHTMRLVTKIDSLALKLFQMRKGQTFELFFENKHKVSIFVLLQRLSFLNLLLVTAIVYYETIAQ